MNQTVPEDDFAEFLGNLQRFVRERLIPNEHRLGEERKRVLEIVRHSVATRPTESTPAAV